MVPAYETIRFEAEGGVATVTLHRPEKLNAYVPLMGEEILDAFARARDDAGVRAVLLAGAGRAFCAGVDLDHLRALERGEAAGPGPRLGEEAFLQRFPLELAAFPKPVLAALHGAAVGVGVTMTLGCDVRLAAEDAVLSLPFVRLGILPGLGSTHFLPRLVGPSRALELVLSGRKIGAAEAAAVGLVSRVVPTGALAKEARECAAALGAARPEVVAAARTALRFGAGASLEEALRYEKEASAALRRGD